MMTKDTKVIIGTIVGTAVAAAIGIGGLLGNGIGNVEAEMRAIRSDSGAASAGWRRTSNDRIDRLEDDLGSRIDRLHDEMEDNYHRLDGRMRTVEEDSVGSTSGWTRSRGR